MKEKIQASSRVRGSNIDIVKLYYFSKNTRFMSVCGLLYFPDSFENADNL
jgi:hypothetical protein